MILKHFEHVQLHQTKPSWLFIWMSIHIKELTLCSNSFMKYCTCRNPAFWLVKRIFDNKANLRTLPDMVTEKKSKVSHYRVFQIALRGGGNLAVRGGKERWEILLGDFFYLKVGTWGGGGGGGGGGGILTIRTLFKAKLKTTFCKYWT